MSAPDEPCHEVALRQRFARIKTKLRKLAAEAGLIER
jgi:hypothetical protein